MCEVPVQGEGYRLSYRVASDSLQLGTSVVADSCNPWELTRDEWQAVATDANADYVNIEVVCSDPKEHRNRVETRESPIPGLKLPTWGDVENRDYHPWTRSRIIIDTAGRTRHECFSTLAADIHTLTSPSHPGSD